jgi:hypothetical protein
MSKVNFTVSYNRISKACQVNVITIVKNEEIEYIKDDTNTTQGPKIVEIGAIE